MLGVHDDDDTDRELRRPRRELDIHDDDDTDRRTPSQSPRLYVYKPHLRALEEGQSRRGAGRERRLGRLQLLPLSLLSPSSPTPVRLPPERRSQDLGLPGLKRDLGPDQLQLLPAILELPNTLTTGREGEAG